jgi:hypothetical protein
MSYATRQIARLTTHHRGVLPRRTIGSMTRVGRCQPRGEIALVAAGLVLGLCACSGQSNSVLPGEDMPNPPGGTAGNTAMGGTPPVASAGSSNSPAPGGGGRAGSEGFPVTTGGLSGVAGGSGGAPNNTGNGGTSATGCQVRTNVTLAVLATIPVSWPATLGTTGGTGDFELLNVYRMTVDAAGTATAQISPCGSTLPPFTFSGLIGGGNCLIEIPDSVWDTPEFPSFPTAGTIGGWEPGSALDVPSTGVALVGLDMSDPNAAWPESYTGIQSTDPDADGNSGITSIPASGQGFASPPASIIGPRVDRVYVVNRTSVDLSGTFTSCNELQGDATLGFFDNHVVGCRTVDGANCNATQTDFVDVNRTIYEASPGTFTARVLPEGATCADARAAFP